ncbi:HlyD family type I secretion periplasmic adaptor subunit [Roseomonas sp. CECT 9278]|uniref:HlyD family type I secretion periplasmic adaptor subunit n=1 Tax=Roseomonas sp. CECT 9278 TaxID=2845823 RepID=UPI001E2D0CD6|nr:HlyD family type I secretion periplasmic adaptor subunit [Roseomonas sp. CECT 9278]CAH0147146.1 Hemolysin secretion protein D, plasmid [Roseomonas sp. CECT 9278]
MTTRRALPRRRRRAPGPAPEAVPFQDPLEAVIAEPPPRLLRGVHWLVAALFVALVGIAAVAQVDVVVTGAGRLAPDAPPIVLQPMERAVIREIRVRPGDVVRRGDVLALLDPSFAEADRAALAAQRGTIAATLARLDAELAGLAAPDAPDRDARLQAGLQAQRAAFVATRLRALDEEMQGQRTAIRALEDADAAAAEQVAIARDIEALRARLLEGQIGSRLALLEARARRIAAEQQREQDRARLGTLRHALTQKQAERQAFLDDWRRQVLEEVARLRAEAARVDEAHGKAVRLAELTTIVAPADGTVLDVARRSAGSILREAEPLVTLVPAGAPLIAEVALRSADVGQARPGDAAVVKIDAFPWQRHGALAGRLRAIAQDSRGEDGAPAAPAGALHRAQVVLDAPVLAGGTPMPGMTVTAEIHVGSRSLLATLLQPLIRGARESLREP